MAERRDGFLWITEQDVADDLSLPEAIGVLSRGLSVGRQQLLTLTKTQLVSPNGSSMHALGGLDLSSDVCGTKTWIHSKEGASPLMIVWQVATGKILAVIEAFALGQLRTASTTGVATDALAARGATSLAMIGTGKQALPQVAAVLAVRPIERVKVYSRTPDHRAAFAEAVEATFDVAVETCESAAEAASGADVITTATRATEAFLTDADVAPHAHINAIGAITPERMELAADLVASCDVIVVDEPRAAREHAAELRGCDHLLTLADVLTERPHRQGRSLFKAMGSGASDLVLAAELVARRAETAATRPHPTRAHIRLGGSR